MSEDKLEKIFKMQEELNGLIWSKCDLRSSDKVQDWSELSKYLKERASTLDEKPLFGSDTLCQWIDRMIWAMGDEVRELQEEIPKKWWSKDPVNIQNARVEVIDILHFWVSVSMFLGLDANKVFDIYEQKHSVNIKRQETEYNKADKTEKDNEQIR
jgi:dimeric dUTPase (all-alpha-NTP-PPase superfamily)